MIPNISEEVVLQLKNLKPGNCIAFGQAFKVPTVMYLDMPNPTPLSNNVDLNSVWYQEQVSTPAQVQAPAKSEVGMIMEQQVQTNKYVQQPALVNKVDNQV